MSLDPGDFRDSGVGLFRRLDEECGCSHPRHMHVANRKGCGVIVPETRMPCPCEEFVLGGEVVSVEEVATGAETPGASPPSTDGDGLTREQRRDRARAHLRQQVWEASQHLGLDEISDLVAVVLMEIESDEP